MPASTQVAGLGGTISAVSMVSWGTWVHRVQDTHRDRQFLYGDGAMNDTPRGEEAKHIRRHLSSQTVDVEISIQHHRQVAGDRCRIEGEDDIGASRQRRRPRI
jgi:hypothetical protein